jgi:hypothetical protein
LLNPTYRWILDFSLSDRSALPSEIWACTLFDNKQTCPPL